jgi:hypothetical protein
MRLLLAALAGVAVTVAGAVVLGDYPLSGSVPWLAAIVIPFLIGTAMYLVTDRYRPQLWAMTGVLGALSLAWGFRVATGYGLDPLPASCWAAVVIALVWPPAGAALSAYGRRRRGDSPG